MVHSCHWICVSNGSVRVGLLTAGAWDKTQGGSRDERTLVQWEVNEGACLQSKFWLRQNTAFPTTTDWPSSGSDDDCHSQALEAAWPRVSRSLSSRQPSFASTKILGRYYRSILKRIRTCVWRRYWCRRRTYLHNRAQSASSRLGQHRGEIQVCACHSTEHAHGNRHPSTCHRDNNFDEWQRKSTSNVDNIQCLIVVDMHSALTGTCR